MKVNRSLAIVVLLLCISWPLPVGRANPSGGQVKSGSATFDQPSPGMLNINQTSDRVIINWQDFSIQAGEVTKFIQPSASAAALNRVITGNPSKLFGSLEANGQVFLINQNGILVGKGGRVDTAGFVASTLDLADAAFLSGGNLKFAGNSTAGINNQGTISGLGGDVFLIAHTVDNSGSIRAPSGVVGLAAGSEVWLAQSGTERLTVAAGNANAPQAANGVNNVGLIEATAAELKAAGGNIYALAINNGGVVRATSVANENGTIVLKANGGNIQNSGTLSAHNADGSGGSVIVDGGHNTDGSASIVINSGTIEARGNLPGTSGGTVELLGDRVGLVDSAVVDVSGDAAGGTALIGGDYHGNNPAVQNAQGTYVSPDASILADALMKGNGGKVIVWADDLTAFYGSISARGTGAGGNGGFAEISSGLSLDAPGKVDLAAVHGLVGTLLYDPLNIQIQGGTADGSDTVDTSANNLINVLGSNLQGTITFLDEGLLLPNPFVITESEIENTDANITLQARHSITTSGTFTGNDLVLMNNRSLTLQTLNTIVEGAGVIDLTGSSAGNNLEIKTQGTGAITIQAATSGLAAGNVILCKLTTAGGTVSVSSGNGSITLPNVLNAGGGAVNLTATAPIQETGSGSISAGAVLVGAGVGSDIALNSANNNFGTFTVSSGNNVTVKNSASITLGASTVAGGLDVTAGGSILESGALLVTGAGTFTVTAANSDVLLAGFPNSLAAVTIAASGAGSVRNVSVNNISLTAPAPTLPSTLQNLTLTDSGSITLPALTLTGDFNVSAGGNITQSGTLTVGGTATLDAGAGNNITLSGANDFNTVVIGSANNVTLHDINGLTFGASTISGNLNVTANGAITQSGAETVSGVATFAAGAGNNITLNSANSFGTVIIGSANNVTLNNASSLDLGASTISGALGVTASGAISQSGTLNVSGAGTFTVTAANSDVLLADFANNLAGITVVASGAGSVRDVAIRNVSGSATFPVLPASVSDLTLIFDNAVVNFPATTVIGDLNVTAGGNITDSGTLTVGGTATFSAGTGNNITLDNADDFRTVIIASANNVALNDMNALNLGASTVSGNLSITANGAITDSGTVIVGGTATLAAGAGNDITLDNADDFNTVEIASARNMTLNDVNALNLGASAVSGNLSVTANGAITDSGTVTVSGTATFAAGAGNDITLDNADDFNTVAITSARNVTLNDVNALDLGASTVAGNLNVAANGGITDSGTLTVGGTTTFAAGTGNEITLNNADDFNTVVITSARDVALNDVNALNLGNSTVSGNLNVTANGAITDSGTLTIGGTATFAAGAANNITLDNADDFNTVAISSANEVTLHDVNALNLGASTVSGSLNVTANGAISDSGTVTVGGTATFAAGAGNNITLDNADDFATVVITSARDVTLHDVNALNLGASTVSGDLNVTANGGITDSGTVTVSGTATFAAGAAHNITLDNADDFNTVAIESANNVTLSDVNSVSFGASTVSGNLSVTANGAITDSGAVSVGGTATFAAGAANDITLDNADDFNTVVIGSAKNVTLNDVNALDLGASIVSGNLHVTANGAITDSGSVTVSGTATFAAGAGNDIMLDNADDFGMVAITSGHNVTLNDFSGVNLGASTVSGDLHVTANGAITDSGTVLVGGTATFAAGAGNDVTLDNADDFNIVAITSANNVTLNDVNTLNLGASTVSGNLHVMANGAITDSGAVSVGGTATFAAGASHDITLDNADDFNAVVITSAKNVTLNDVNAIDFGASTVSGNLDVTADGAITDSGALLVGGTATFAAGTGNSITLDNADNFNTVTIASANNVTLNDINALNLGVSTISGNLHVTANGAITDSGTVTVGGTATLAAGAGNDITLDNADDFNIVVIASAKDVTLNDVNALDLGASTVSGNLHVTPNGAITDSGTVSVGGTATFAAGAGNDITLNNADDFNTVVITSAKDVTLTDANAIDLGASTISGNLHITANGAITDSGALMVGGTATFAAGAGNDITLNNADDFSTVVITSGKDVTLNNVTALNLGASAVSGNLNLTANGPITDSGTVAVGGNATFTTTANGAGITLDSGLAITGTLGLHTTGAGADATVINANAVNLAATDVGGNLSVRAIAGDITDSGTVVVGGNVTFTASPGASIILDSAGNTFNGAVAFVSSGPGNLNNVTVVDTKALDLGALTINGSLNVAANGAITDSGTVTVGGTATFAAGPNHDITLDNADNFNTVVISSAKDVTLHDVNALNLGGAAVSGNLSVAANGAITDSGTVTVGGTATFSAGIGNDITLDNADDFHEVIIDSANNVTLNDVNGIDLGASTLSGDLVVTAHGAVTQSGSIDAAGLGVTSSGSVTLTANNDVDVVAASLTGSGKSFLFTDANGITVGTVGSVSGITTVNGTVTLTADQLEIAQAVDTGTGRVTIQPSTPGQPISLGTEITGQLSLTSTELGLITAGALHIGDTTAGPITVSTAIALDPIKTPTLTLQSNGEILETGSGAINVANLAIVSAGPVVLLGNNDVDMLAVDTESSFAITDPDGFKVGTVDGVTGVDIDGVNLGFVSPKAAALISRVEVPTPLIVAVDYDTEWIATSDLVNDLVGPGAIWTSSLQQPFPKERTQRTYLKLEQQSHLEQWPLGRHRQQ